MNKILMTSNTVLDEFKIDFRQIKRRMEHLLDEFHKTVRNEYEHPSLQPKKVGNIMEWGSLFLDGQGNIRVHVGKKQFAIVRKEYLNRLNSLWITLIDTLLKHFSDKPSSTDLLQQKKQVEDNIDLIIDTYAKYRRENKNEEANHIIHQILMWDLHLAREGISLSQDIKDKLYSTLWGTKF